MENDVLKPGLLRLVRKKKPRTFWSPPALVVRSVAVSDWFTEARRNEWRK
jgi:hypothetical protein